MLAQTRIKLRGVPKRSSGARHSILLKSSNRLVSELCEPGGVTNRGTLRRQLGIFGRAEVCRPQLLELPAQVLLLFLTPGSEPLEVMQRAHG